MGGVGSGNWYRFDKKTTTGECHSVDLRYHYRQGLLALGHWFSLRWSRADRETGSIRCAVLGDEKPVRVILTYRHRSSASGAWKEVSEPVALSWTACNFGVRALVCLFRSGLRPEGCDPLRTRALLPVPPLLRPPLRKPARRQDAPCSSPDAGYPGEARREHEHDEAFS